MSDSYPLNSEEGIRMIREADKIVFKDDTTYEADTEKGVLYEKFNGAIQAMVEVRANLKEIRLRELVIAELRLLGYTVIEP